MANQKKPTEHWQTGLTNVNQRMSYLRKSAKFADLTITFPDIKKVIPAHKWMLAVSSPVFEAMFFGPLAEKVVLNLPDDPPEAFEWILDHLYCEERTLPNMDLAMKVYKLADKYEMKDLFRLCSEYLCKEAHANNLPLLYDLAYLVEDTLLLGCCEKILVTKSDEALRSDSIVDLPRKTLRHLLENQNFRPSSSLVTFECLRKWGQDKLSNPNPAKIAQMKGSEVSKKPQEKEQGAEKDQNKESSIRGIPLPSPRSLRQCLESLLPFVDFMSLSVDEFVEHVVPTGIFSPEESMSVLQGIKDVPGPSLPTCVKPRTAPKQELSVKSAVLLNKIAQNGQIEYVTFQTNGCHNLFNIQTSHPISLLEVECPGITSLSEGILLLLSDNANVIKGIWKNDICQFRNPIHLIPGKSYKADVKLHQAWWPFRGSCFNNACGINIITNGIKITGQARMNTEIRIKYTHG